MNASRHVRSAGASKDCRGFTHRGACSSERNASGREQRHSTRTACASPAAVVETTGSASASFHVLPCADSGCHASEAVAEAITPLCEEGEAHKSIDCVSLEGGGNAELRVWKALSGSTSSAESLQTHPKPEHALFAAWEIIILVQGGDALAKKAMADLSPEGRCLAVEESSNLVLSLLKRDADSGSGQTLSKLVRRWSQRALHKRTRTQHTGCTQIGRAMP